MKDTTRETCATCRFHDIPALYSRKGNTEEPRAWGYYRRHAPTKTVGEGWADKWKLLRPEDVADAATTLRFDSVCAKRKAWRAAGGTFWGSGGWAC